MLTDYAIRNATILYNRNEPSTVPMPLTVTLPGGRIDVRGRSFTSHHEALPGLPSGQDVVLCLQRAADTHLLALRNVGAFALRGDHLDPLTRKEGFAPELRRVVARDVLSRWVARARVLHGRR